MPITTKFIALWFLFSSIVFLGLVTILRTRSLYHEQPDRDINTFLIIFSQGIGAAIAYALY